MVTQSHRYSITKMSITKLSTNPLLLIPHPLVITILNKVSHDGFEHLGPLMATGKFGKDLVYQEEVLKAASLSTFLQAPVYVNKWSKYRCFFKRCVDAGNPTACYLESLRLVTREGLIDDSINLLFNTIPYSEEMAFTLGLLLICRGHYDEGMATMTTFLARVGSHDRAEFISNIVFQHIREIGPLTITRYRATWRFFDVPKCVGVLPILHSMESRCEMCFIWWRTIQFICMF